MDARHVEVRIALAGLKNCHDSSLLPKHTVVDERNRKRDLKGIRGMSDRWDGLLESR